VSIAPGARLTANFAEAFASDFLATAALVPVAEPQYVSERRPSFS
jgi:hypothetical protein